jgi:S1-C subfamily serine protease
MISIRSLAVLLVSAALAVPALAQDRRVPSSAAELRLSFAPIVQRVQPAVVNVYAAKVVQNHNPFLDDPIFTRNSRRSTSQIRTSSWSATSCSRSATRSASARP